MKKMEETAEFERSVVQVDPRLLLLTSVKVWTGRQLSRRAVDYHRGGTSS